MVDDDMCKHMAEEVDVKDHARYPKINEQALGQHLYIESFGISDIGLSRLNNEDVWAHLKNENFFVLADGMGGHQAGEIAANETIVKLCNWVQTLLASPRAPKNIEQLTPLLEKAIHEANLWVYNLSTQNEEMTGMGTTLCLALLVGNDLLYAHVGDSRIYRVRKGRITRLTADHSLRNELIASGQLDERDAATFPHKNVITRAIGTQPHVIPEIQSTDVKPEDLYFLCSDGLTDCLSDRDILSVIQQYPLLKEATAQLVEQAKRKGGPDNITVVMFRVCPRKP